MQHSYIRWQLLRLRIWVKLEKSKPVHLFWYLGEIQLLEYEIPPLCIHASIPHAWNHPWWCLGEIWTIGCHIFSESHDHDLSDCLILWISLNYLDFLKCLSCKTKTWFAKRVTFPRYLRLSKKWLPWKCWKTTKMVDDGEIVISIAWVTWPQWRRHKGQSQACPKGCQLEVKARWAT